MLEHIVNMILDILIPVCELMGIFVVAVSALSAFGRYVRHLLTGDMGDIKFRLAAGLALSLEFKMAAEILRTVLVQSLDELYMLGAVILIRALLSLLIHWEIKPHEKKD